MINKKEKVPEGFNEALNALVEEFAEEDEQNQNAE